MLNRIFAENIFVTRIKTNTDYRIVKELELPLDTDQDILKDEIITLSGKKAIDTKINEHNLRLATVYRVEDKKVIHIITNNLHWTVRTVAGLYKKRWDIELFFKAMKQNLQIKTFLGTSENTVKSQIYVALISYLLLELINRTIAQKVKTFSNFVENIRVCLVFYLSIEYVCNQVNERAKKVINQRELVFKPDLFSQ